MKTRKFYKFAFLLLEQRIVRTIIPSFIIEKLSGIPVQNINVRNQYCYLIEPVSVRLEEGTISSDKLSNKNNGYVINNQ